MFVRWERFERLEPITKQFQTTSVPVILFYVLKFSQGTIRILPVVEQNSKRRH